MLFDSKPIEFDGKIYKSQHELAKTFNLSITMVSQLKNNPEKLKTYITNKIQGKINRPIKDPLKNIGLVIGDFKITEYIGQYKSLGFKYKCVCTKCGHTITKEICNLRYKCKCSHCNRHNKDIYVNTQIGDFKILERIETPSHKFTKYRAICPNCGYEKIQPIHQIKKDCKCKKCRMAIKVYKSFEELKKKGLENYDIITYTYERGKEYKYLLKCKHCGKEVWVNKNSIPFLKICDCQKHENGKLMAKHHGEIINGWLLEDTGKNAYNSRNRLYKYTCTECGAVKYDQFSKAALNIKCKHGQTKVKKVKEVKKSPKTKKCIDDIFTLKITKGKIIFDTKSLDSFLKDDDMEGLRDYISKKLQKREFEKFHAKLERKKLKLAKKKANTNVK